VRPLSSAFLLVGIVACAPRSVPPSTAPEGINLNVPPSIGAFSLADRQVFDDPAFGTRLRYTGPDSMYADLYLYPGPTFASRCDQALAARAAEEQVSTLKESFPALIERRYFDSIAVARDESLQPDPAAPWCSGRHVTLNVVRDGAPQDSHFYLYVLSGYFVKVRLTYPSTEPRMALEREFISDLFTKLQRQ
jgi:hypothetical protein